MTIHVSAKLKRFGIVIFVLTLAYNVYADVRTPNEAQQAAIAFLTSHTNQARKSTNAHLELAYTYTDSIHNEPAVYIFNKKANEGYVLVSAHTGTRTILGYADEGRCQADNMPEPLQALLQLYTHEMAQANASAEGESTTTDRTYQAVEPLLGDIAWGQGAPYNAMCPTKNGDRAVVGCVGIAVAQIMRYYQWPAKGTGQHSYYCSWIGSNLSANFAATTYDWKAMKEDYSTPFTLSEQNAVATLCRHVGIASDMIYGGSKENGSATYLSTAIQALSTYFGYDKAITYLDQNYCSEAELMEGICHELKAGRPLLVNAQTSKKEGHAYICDGIDKNGMLHFNWGWYGSMNGYYALSAMTPKEQGIGGASSGYGFTEKICFYAGIQPNQGGVSPSHITCDRIRFGCPEHISKYSTINIYATRIHNKGKQTWSGDLDILVYNQDTTLVKCITAYSNLQMKAGDYQYDQENGGVSFSLNAYNQGLPNGRYFITIGTQTLGVGTPCPLQMANTGKTYIPMTITRDSIFIDYTGKESEPYEFDNMYARCQKGTSSPYTWILQLQTKDFRTSDATTYNNATLLLQLESNSGHSFLGSYTYSTEANPKCGDIRQIALYHGILSSPIPQYGSTGYCDISFKDGMYTIAYNLTFKDITIYDKLQIPYSAVVSIVKETGEWIVLDELQQYEDASPYYPKNLVATAKEDSVTFTWKTINACEYIIQIEDDKGNTILTDTTAKTSMTVYSPHSITYHWSVTSYSAAKQSALSNAIQATSTPTYFKPFHIETKNLGNNLYQVSWQLRDTAARYDLRIHSTNYEADVAKEIQTPHKQTVLTSGIHWWEVITYDNENTRIGKTYSDNFTTYPDKDYNNISNLQGTYKDETLQYSWNGNVQAYDISLYNGNGELIEQERVETKEFTYSPNTEGLYTLYISPIYYPSSTSWVHYSYAITVEADHITGIEEQLVDDDRFSDHSTIKMLRGTQVLIYKNGEYYTVQGQKVLP